MQYSKTVEHIPFLVSQVFTRVYYLYMYIVSLFVINMEGMVLFLWLPGVFIREYTECPFTHRHLSDVCSVFTYMPYSWHTTEYLQCDRLYTLHNVCFRTVHLCLSVVSLGTRGATNLDNDSIMYVRSNIQPVTVLACSITNTCSLARTVSCYISRIVRPHLGGDAVLYSVSIGTSVGSLLSGNMKALDLQ